jgi:hypothetical protein
MSPAPPPTNGRGSLPVPRCGRRALRRCRHRRNLHAPVVEPRPAARR